MKKRIVLLFFLFLSVYLSAEETGHYLSVQSGSILVSYKDLKMMDTGYASLLGSTFTVAYQYVLPGYSWDASLYYKHDEFDPSRGIDDFNYILSYMLGINCSGFKTIVYKNAFFLNLGLDLDLFYNRQVLHRHQIITDEFGYETYWSAEVPTWRTQAVIMPMLELGLDSERFYAGFYGGLSLARIALFADNRNTAIIADTSTSEPEAGPFIFSFLNEYLELKAGVVFKLHFGDHWTIFLDGYVNQCRKDLVTEDQYSSLEINTGFYYRF